jgi:glyoxylase-like metal-dependent hydrolase (beta-lactamase superfamily II)
MAGIQVETDGWLSAYRVGEGTYRISDNGQDNIYLLAGEEKALLIDTGWGVGKLMDLVERITRLPLIVVNTHGHCDHALGNDQFNHVILGESDARRLTIHDVGKKREFIRRGKLLIHNESMPLFGQWGCPALEGIEYIEDGMELDLGSRTVTAHLTPGHTMGSVCYVDKETRTLFAGDSYVPLAYWGPMWLHLDESGTLLEYHEAMSRLLSSGGFDSILPGHGECGPLPARQLEELLSGIRAVLQGSLEGVFEKTMVGSGLRCDWKDTGIIYKPGDARR